MTALASDLSGMHPYLTGAHLALHREAEEFAREVIAPRVPAMEAKGTHADREIAHLMGERGWFGVLLPQAFGGVDAGHVARSVLLTTLSRHTAAGAAAAILQASLIPTGAIEALGSEPQNRTWLPPIAAGAVFPTVAVTEPVSGSHLLGMASTARRRRKHWQVTGVKCFVGNSGISGLHLVVARTGRPGDKRSLTAFLIEADRPGLTVTQPPLIGLHGFTAGTLTLDRVDVPHDNVLGDVGDGLEAAHIGSVVIGRPNFAAIALGLHQQVVDTTTRFLTTRPRYDATLADLDVVRHHLGEMKLRLMNAQVSAFHAVDLLDRGLPCDDWLISSKVGGKQAVASSLAQAQDLHGGQAVRADYPLERLARDIAHIPAPAGPDDIQLLRLGARARPHHHQWSAQYLLRTGRTASRQAAQ